jgi:hypothetical protein
MTTFMFCKDVVAESAAGGDQEAGIARVVGTHANSGERVVASGRDDGKLDVAVVKDD